MRRIDRRLLEACQDGDLRAARAFLREGADVNCRDDAGRTPLIIATQHGHIPIINLLIEHGANINIADQHQNTALHYAVKNRNHQAIQCLTTELKSKSNAKNLSEPPPPLLTPPHNDIPGHQHTDQPATSPPLSNHDQSNDLFDAIERGDLKLVQHLITEVKINPNIRGKNGITPIILAVIKGDNDIFNFLFENGAIASISDDQGLDALHHAVLCDQYDMARRILEEVFTTADHRDKRGRTAFIHAARSNNIRMIQLLTQFGADPDLTDKDGLHALHHAIKKKHMDVIEYLIADFEKFYRKVVGNFRLKYFYFNALDRYDLTIFHFAVIHSDIEVLDLLVRLGADPHIVDPLGRTALYNAIEYNNTRVAEYLIKELKLDPNARDRYKMTPFMMAAVYADVDMLQMLAQNGADPYAIDRYGQNALHIALKNIKRYEVVRYLLTHFQFDINAKDRSGMTPIMIATQKGDTKMIELLEQHSVRTKTPPPAYQEATRRPGGRGRG